MLNLVISFIVVVGTVMFASWWLFRLSVAGLAESGDRPTSARGQRRRGRWRFTPETLGGFSFLSLFLISAFGLFLELLIIRWVSSEIRIFAYFKNFVLIACFLGFGMGCYLCRRPVHLWTLLGAVILLVVLIELPIQFVRGTIDALPNYIGAVADVHVWGLPSLPWETKLVVGLVGAIGVTVSLFLLIAVIFIPVGQLVGWYLENAAQGITAYTVNVLGSLAGVAAYTVLCFLEHGPVIWFLVAGAILGVSLWKAASLRWTSLLSFALCAALLFLADIPRKGNTYWSPYQKLTLTPVHDEDGNVLSYQLTTNNSRYQQIIDLSDDFVAAHEDLLQGVPIERNAYNLPYRFYPAPPSVLVLGAGMGNDVAAALRNGAGSVVAVEIDPLIVKLGTELHFERPYDSPKLRIVVDDARHFIENAIARFDMIVFSLLDSHTTSSHYSNIRTDNFVYTVEAMEAAKRLLEPDGILVVKFQVETPWIAGRLRDQLTDLFGSPPLQLQAEKSHTTTGRFFISGSPSRLAKALSDPDFAAYVRRQGQVETEPCTPTTDDWPYFYQREPGIPASIALVSLALAWVGTLAIRGAGTSVRNLQWHFFFLGAGFMLLEVQIVSKSALVFGTTWMVNSVVIGALLMMIVGANTCAKLFPNLAVEWAYVGLAVTIGLAYALPLRFLALDSLWLRILGTGGFLCVPAFFAGVIFIRSFAAGGFRGDALGSNLFGSLVGGLLESLSFAVGINALLLAAGALYIASFIALPKRCTGVIASPAAGAAIGPAR